MVQIDTKLMKTEERQERIEHELGICDTHNHH
jgi:hypothetical protein